MKKVFYLFFLILSAFLIYFYGKGIFENQIHKPYGEKGEIILEIKSGTGLKEAARLLKKEGVIREEILFLAGHYIYFKNKTIKAGEYKFELPLSLYQVLEKIIHGDIYLRSVTIPEGSSIKDIAEILGDSGLVNKDEFLEKCKSNKLVNEFNRDALDLEGFLFPDTYFLPKGITSEKIIEIMFNRFKERVGIYKEKAEKMGFNFYEIIILASLIEKETAVPHERPLVSSVFHNRLKKGIPLQCDPTVIYAMKKEDAFHPPLKGEDLLFPSPYNTYIHRGLPPGPICSPGISSIESALNPAKTEYLYFVSNGDGTHTFSSDLTSHNRAVGNYKRKLRESNIN